MQQIFLKRYEAVRLLGQGRLGRVYLARQVDLGRLVALKVVHKHLAGDLHFQECFQRETPRLLRFQHPYAISFFDASLNDPQGPCLVMEYIRGIPLDELARMNKGRLSPGRVARLLSQLCEVIQAAHNEDLIHGELKPADILIVDADTPFEKVKVMDLGIGRLRVPGENAGPSARFPPPDDPASPPVGGQAMSLFADSGVSSYSSPERLRGESLDHRADVYTLGVILHELLTGKTPGSKTAGEGVAPTRVSRTSPSALPPAVEAVVLACLEPDPAQRLSSALELAELFKAALASPVLPPVGAASRAAPEAPLCSPGLKAEEQGGGPAQAPAPCSITPDIGQKIIDPDAVVYQMEAWMPQAVAEHKIRGFVQDTGGHVLESIPGLIRVRLGDPETKYELKKGMFSWFDRRTGLIEMFLRLQTGNRNRQINVTVLLRSLDGERPDNPDWQDRCTGIYHDLRGYLMGRDRDMPEKSAES
jgi:serine/threonine-protein kinase